MKTMHLFAGIGGGLLADLILGHDPIIAVEWDKYACRVLRERAADGWFPSLHVWEGDVRLFDPSEYAGRVDCIHAGFPCQDISVAGKQAGVSEGTRSGLYREVLRIADIVRPRLLFLENVAAILSNGLGTVLADLAAMGFSCRWCCIRASDVGAPHHRDRWFCLAKSVSERAGSNSGASDSDRRRDAGRDESAFRQAHGQDGADRAASTSSIEGDVRNPEHAGLNATEVTGSIAQGSDGNEAWQEPTGEPAGSGDTEVLADAKHRRFSFGRRTENSFENAIMPFGIYRDDKAGLQKQEREVLADSDSALGKGNECTKRSEQKRTNYFESGWWTTESDVGRVAHGIPNRVGQLKGYGNAQVPLQAAAAWRLLGGDR